MFICAGIEPDLRLTNAFGVPSDKRSTNFQGSVLIAYCPEANS